MSGCPCNETTIELYKGTANTGSQECRRKLLIFLKGTKEEKSKLKKEDPVSYENFESVWTVRNSHMVKALPSQYIFSFCVATNQIVHTHCVYA